MVKKNKELSAKEAADKLTSNSPNAVITTIPPEKKYVRRTSRDFKRGAEPVVGRGSHRLVEQKITMTPELLEAAKCAAKESNVPFTMWVRAALRKALRDSMDTSYELETEVDISALPDVSEPHEPKK